MAKKPMKSKLVGIRIKGALLRWFEMITEERGTKTITPTELVTGALKRVAAAPGDEGRFFWVIAPLEELMDAAERATIRSLDSLEDVVFIADRMKGFLPKIKKIFDKEAIAS